MSKTNTTAFSGCLIWFLLITLIGTCVMPIFFLAGSLSSFSGVAIKTTGGWLCPEATTPESHSYATTTRDENGFERPSTAYELHCVDEAGKVVKRDPVLYALIWIGISSAVGVIVTVVLSFVLAVPGGMLAAKLLEKLKSPKATAEAAD